MTWTFFHLCKFKMIRLFKTINVLKKNLTNTKYS